MLLIYSHNCVTFSLLHTWTNTLRFAFVLPSSYSWLPSTQIKAKKRRKANNCVRYMKNNKHILLYHKLLLLPAWCVSPHMYSMVPRRTDVSVVAPRLHTHRVSPVNTGSSPHHWFWCEESLLVYLLCFHTHTHTLSLFVTAFHHVCNREINSFLEDGGTTCSTYADSECATRLGDGSFHGSTTPGFGKPFERWCQSLSLGRSESYEPDCGWISRGKVECISPSSSQAEDQNTSPWCRTLYTHWSSPSFFSPVLGTSKLFLPYGTFYFLHRYQTVMLLRKPLSLLISVKHGHSCLGRHYWRKRWTIIRSGSMCTIPARWPWPHMTAVVSRKRYAEKKL
jgi:hypothetical protein